MNRFITLHEIGNDVAYVNIEQIEFVHDVKHLVGGSQKTFTMVVATHGFLEVEESKSEVMDLIKAANRSRMGGY